MKDIPGFEGIYAITTDGKVWSYPKKVGRSNRIGKFLATRPSTNKYLFISISRNSKLFTRRVHRLVAETYLPNLDNLPEVNHKNGIKTDNRVENLEWCTPQQNRAHANSIGHNNAGIKNWNALLDDDKVRQIRTLRAQGTGIDDIAPMFLVTRRTIEDVCARRRWAHVL